MESLASPLHRMDREYDVVVVGSGYGGAIAASRLARAGRKVCVLERGREWRSGEFPEGPAEGLRAVQADGPKRRVGSSTALFDFRMNPDISVLSGCGLGGTSLINANVAIRPDPRVWLDPVWPEAFRADVEDRLEEGVGRALEMLRPAAFPDDREPPVKLEALEAAAAAIGARSYRLPIAVNFQEGLNHVGVRQEACTSCGNCVGGCNVGAKNALTTNYLPDARRHGAEIFTQTAVQRVERREGGWVVHFDLLEPGARRFESPGRFVSAGVVVLAAGSLGSTEILLRSRDAGLSLSDRLGERFTGNGDVLGFAYNVDVPVEGVAVGSRSRRPGPGPCITGVIDLRDTERLEDGMIIQEGVIPSSFGPLLATSMMAAARTLGRDTDSGFADWSEERFRELQALVPGGSSGSVGHTMTFLVMAHDDSAGRIHLVDDRPRISWPDVGKQEIFERIDRQLLRLTGALGGTYIKNPIWAERMGRGLITVHPLGGCGMGESADEGVVDHGGRVFAGASGRRVHDGLYVCDGAVMPRSLGANPFLTIAAFAERACALMAEEGGWSIPYELPGSQGVGSHGGNAPRVGIRFTEAMRGWFFADPELDFEAAAQRGEAASSTMQFTVTVAAEDLETFLTSAEHRAALHGTVTAPALSPDALTVAAGTFDLLTQDPEDPRARRMTYRMPLEARDGTRYFLHGVKHVRDDPGFDMWSDTTTLYVTVHRGTDGAGPVVGRGILKIRPRDFAKQLRTVEVTNAGSLGRRLKAAADFGRFFAGSLYDTYGAKFMRRSNSEQGEQG